MRNATTNNHNPEPNHERSYLNTVMTVIACLLAVIAFDLVIGTPPASEAQAAGRSLGASGQLNPGAQRQDMIIELRRLNGQLNEISASLGGTIEVDVVRMPAGGAGD